MKVNVCGVDYDLNDIFSMSYTFDVLKNLILALVKSNNELRGKNDLLDKTFRDNLKNDLVVDLEKKIENIEENFEKRIKYLEYSTKNKSKGNDNDGKNKQNNDNKSQNGNMSVGYDDELLERVIDLEAKFSKFNSDINSSSKLERISELSSKYSEMKYDLNVLTSKVDELAIQSAGGGLNEVIKQMKSSNEEEGSINQSMILIASLDEKTNKRFQIENEKMNKFQKTIESLESKIVSIQEKTEEKLRNYLLEINGISATINKLTQTTDKKTKDILNQIEKTNKEFATLKEYVEHLPTQQAKQKESESNVNTQSLPSVSNYNNIVNANDIVNSLQMDINKQFSALSKRINDLDKQFKIFQSKIDPQAITFEFSKITKQLTQIVPKESFYNLQDEMEAMKSKFISLKDLSNKIIDDSSKSQNDFLNLMKKVENLTNQMISFKKNCDQNQPKQKRTIADLTKFMEISVFNDFVKSFNREIEHIRLDIEDSIRKVNSFESDIKLKASNEDLSNVEAFLVKKIDDLKSFSSHKFADRIKTDKKFKLTELEIKYVLEIASKPSDKGDNWLIAKKALNPNVCASCEAYLGELQEKSEYIAWNKIPKVNELNEKTIRIGNGFSRMLNLIKLDTSRTGKDGKNYDSDGEIMGGREERDGKLFRKKMHLPGVQKNGNNSVMLPGEEKDEKEEKEGSDGESNQPKVLKIYKKSKHQTHIQQLLQKQPSHEKKSV